MQIILSRGADVKSKPGKPLNKDEIKNYLIEKFKTGNFLPKEEFLSKLELLRAPTCFFFQKLLIPYLLD